MTEHLDVRRMTEAILSFHEHQIARNLAARDAHPGAIFDVYYDRLVADPIGTVRDIYGYFGLEWSEEYATRLQATCVSTRKANTGRIAMQRPISATARLDRKSVV